jgi:hypothetical protein
MVSQGWLARLEAQPGREQELERFLATTSSRAASEPCASACFLMRYARGDYGVFTALDDERPPGHAAGVLCALERGVRPLLAADPMLRMPAILACKLPPRPQVLTRALLLTFAGRPGRHAEMEHFLRHAHDLVGREPGTAAWFALRLGQDGWGCFGVFPDNAARLAHLTGQLPRELARQAGVLLAGLPELDFLRVLSARFAPVESLYAEAQA